MTEVMEGQHMIHALLKHILEEQKNQIRYLNTTLQEINDIEGMRDRRDTG